MQYVSKFDLYETTAKTVQFREFEGQERRRFGRKFEGEFTVNTRLFAENGASTSGRLFPVHFRSALTHVRPFICSPTIHHRELTAFLLRWNAVIIDVFLQHIHLSVALPMQHFVVQPSVMQ